MSYLNPTRVHFSGLFRADVSTVNNDDRHFDSATFLCGAVSGGEREPVRRRCFAAMARQALLLRFIAARRTEAKAAGGEGGIRTPDRLAPMPHFECGAIDHSATSPGAMDGRLAALGRAEF